MATKIKVTIMQQSPSYTPSSFELLLNFNSQVCGHRSLFHLTSCI